MRGFRSPAFRLSPKNEEGFTLVETVVATVLLVVALLPLAAAVVFLTARPEARVQAEALSLAQREIEEVLANDPVDWREEANEEGPWRIRRAVVRESGLVTITVVVSRTASVDTLASVRSSRLMRSPGTPPDWGE